MNGRGMILKAGMIKKTKCQYDVKNRSWDSGETVSTPLLVKYANPLD